VQDLHHMAMKKKKPIIKSDLGSERTRQESWNTTELDYRSTVIFEKGWLGLFQSNFVSKLQQSTN